MDLERAVTATISYASYFGFPLFPEEIHHWLICSTPVSYEKLRPLLPRELSKPDLRFRSQTDRHSAEKILHTQKLINLLKFIPGLRLVALTGSVAAKNSKKDDDIDLLFITSPHVLWLIRPFVIAIITVFFRRRHPREDHAHAPNAFCPNLWLDSLSLTIPDSKRSLYTAHEVLQIVPLLDRGDSYRHFLLANRWSKKYLANAYQSLSPTTRHRSADRLSFIFAPLNYLFYLIQLLYMFPKKTSETVHLHAAFLHTTDFSGRLNTHLESLNNI